MVVFGSAARDEPNPEDLDLAVRFSRDAKRDVLQLLDDLYELTGIEAVDLMVLDDAGPVARERARSWSCWRGEPARVRSGGRAGQVAVDPGSAR